MRLGFLALPAAVALCGCGYTEQPCQGVVAKSRDVVVVPDHSYQVLDVVVDDGPCSPPSQCRHAWPAGDWCGTFSGSVKDSCTLTVDFLDASGTRRQCTATLTQHPICGNPEPMYLEVDNTPGRPACWTSSATIGDASTAYPVDAGTDQAAYDDSHCGQRSSRTGRSGSMCPTRVDDRVYLIFRSETDLPKGGGDTPTPRWIRTRT